ncbi:FAD-dependent oxidoreductase [Amycolatopsis sp. CA-126428]|uniref:FAD-dependent oxidoreductase n=1 Tax=Amycolatopsis sp. CA-126428 TaxID=2073158 RepID=UPI0011B025D8|nr:NAD(P)/FAD-dependent oxidoreductase [Amycolatopsis sp. CA-126428]
MIDPKVLIVGGGIGGLCLAQGLRRASVSVAVYERDTSSAIRTQGYRISLKDNGAKALHACLPTHLFDLAVATSIRSATRMVFMDTQLRPKFAKPIPPIEPGLAGFGVNRLTLREILLTGVEDIVHFGKTFDHYEELGDEGVRAHFADGSSVEGTLLVGADGTHSPVRRQLVPDAAVDNLGWAVYGKTPLTDDLLAATPDELIDTFNRVIAADGAAISIATCRTASPAPEPLTDIPGYLSWTMSAAGPPPGGPSPHELHELATATVVDWAPAVRRIVAEADVPATFLLAITSAQPVTPWQAPAVTLLGDAVHTMSPGRGDGANIALRDAQVLADLLPLGRSSAAAKAEYERQMLHYGFAAVAASREHPFAPFRPR